MCQFYRQVCWEDDAECIRPPSSVFWTDWSVQWTILWTSASFILIAAASVKCSKLATSAGKILSRAKPFYIDKQSLPWACPPVGLYTSTTSTSRKCCGILYILSTSSTVKHLTLCQAHALPSFINAETSREVPSLQRTEQEIEDRCGHVRTPRPRGCPAATLSRLAPGPTTTFMRSLLLTIFTWLDGTYITHWFHEQCPNDIQHQDFHLCRPRV